MSGLAGVLADHIPPGGYRWHAAYGVPDVQHAVEHAGWQFAYLDGHAVENAVETLRSSSSAMCVLVRGEGPDLGLSSID